MPEILTQADVRKVHSLPFCYLCGQTLLSKREVHLDHVPPRALFAKNDRDFPLKVTAHRKCNNEQSQSDRMIAQLVAVVHGKRPRADDIAIDFEIYDIPGSETPFLGFVNTDIVGQIGRWIRAFHAALYCEFLPYETKSAIHPPFPQGERTDDGVTISGILAQQFVFTEILKKNRVARCIDRIVCNNEKLKYDCVWVREDSGNWICVFGLQLYDWNSLADTLHFPRRSCVGMYRPSTGRPANGTIGTELEFSIPNADPLDAFEA